MKEKQGSQLHRLNPGGRPQHARHPRRGQNPELLGERRVGVFGATLATLAAVGRRDKRRGGLWS